MRTPRRAASTRTSIAFGLSALVSSLLLGSPDPATIPSYFFDTTAQATIVKSMVALEASPARCPPALLERFPDSVFHCGALRDKPRGDPSTVLDRIDAVLRVAGATAGASDESWTRQSKYLSKEFRSGPVRLVARFAPASGQFVVEYPLRLYDCARLDPASSKAHEDQPPPLLIEESRVNPEFPEEARVRRTGGKVELAVLVTREGSVGDMCVLDSAPRGLGFDYAAVRAVDRWRYRPARDANGNPVARVLPVTVTFQIR